jgi:hypothetical protein
MSACDAVEGSSIRRKAAVINANRAHLAEFGIVAPVGCNDVEELLNFVSDSNDTWVPKVAMVSAIAEHDRRWQPVWARTVRARIHARRRRVWLVGVEFGKGRARRDPVLRPATRSIDIEPIVRIAKVFSQLPTNRAK